MNELYITKNLLEAVATMERGCQEAKREINRAGQTPEDDISIVCHSLLWSLANASTGICTALAECSRDRKGKKK